MDVKSKVALWSEDWIDDEDYLTKRQSIRRRLCVSVFLGIHGATELSRDLPSRVHVVVRFWPKIPVLICGVPLMVIIEITLIMSAKSNSVRHSRNTIVPTALLT
ncbi:hypothetical protein DM02DRAFT_665472 [Periconia macrospinosa]|uniref:Uncharacterized protein n=1 Tax=Periconia macrospinosa TaxID=97972 RepID=A0A2V1CWN1_9PLEO|nr:hypothetical protein DM02DRAFT_665472 [Periconia macrospinosa]